MSGLIYTKEAAKILGLNFRTLENWRSLNRGPKFIRCGRSIRYREYDLERYMSQNSYNPELHPEKRRGRQ